MARLGRLAGLSSPAVTRSDGAIRSPASPRAAMSSRWLPDGGHLLFASDHSSPPGRRRCPVLAPDRGSSSWRPGPADARLAGLLGRALAEVERGCARARP